MHQDYDLQHQDYVLLGLGPEVRAAVWMMRWLVAMNVLARREELSRSFRDPEADPNARACAAVRHVLHLAALQVI